MSFIVNPFVFISNYLSDKSLLLDGVDEYVDLGNDSSIQFDTTDEFTWAGWVRFVGTGTREMMVSKWGSGSTGIYFQKETTDKLRVGLGNNFSGGTSRILLNGNTALSSATWYHVAFTYAGDANASNAYVWLDGVDDTASRSDTLNTVNTISDTGINLRIGSKGDGTRFANAYFTDWYFIGANLNSSQINEMIDSGQPTDPNGWSFKSDIVSGYYVNSDDDATGGTGNIKDWFDSNDGTPTNTESGDLSSTIP